MYIFFVLLFVVIIPVAFFFTWKDRRLTDKELEAAEAKLAEMEKNAKMVADADAYFASKQNEANDLVKAAEKQQIKIKSEIDSKKKANFLGNWRVLN